MDLVRFAVMGWSLSLTILLMIRIFVELRCSSMGSMLYLVPASSSEISMVRKIRFWNLAISLRHARFVELMRGAL